MKSWVLWHKPGNGLEPSVKRVYLDGGRAREDFELLNAVPSSAWQLDEFDVFGPVPGMAAVEVRNRVEVEEARARMAGTVPQLPPAKPLAEMTFAEKCMANPHMVVAWCQKCDMPADNVEIVQEGEDVSAIITHHGESVIVNVKPGTGKEGIGGQIILHAFKKDAEAA